MCGGEVRGGVVFGCGGDGRWVVGEWRGRGVCGGVRSANQLKVTR